MEETPKTISLRRDWTYAGRLLWTTVQLTPPAPGSRIASYEMKAIISLVPDDDDDNLARQVVSGSDVDPKILLSKVEEAESLMGQYVDKLTEDLMESFFKASGYSKAYLPVDVTPFSEFKEFQ